MKMNKYQIDSLNSNYTSIILLSTIYLKIIASCLKYPLHISIIQLKWTYHLWIIKAKKVIFKYSLETAVLKCVFLWLSNTLNDECVFVEEEDLIWPILTLKL